MKYTALFFLLVAAFSFVSCGGESDSQDCPFKKKFNPETGDFDICPDAPVTSVGQTPTPVITDKKEIILNAEAVILPGVGAFKDAIENLSERGLIDTIHKFISSGRPPTL